MYLKIGSYLSIYFLIAVYYVENGAAWWSWDCVDGMCLREMYPNTSSVNHTLDICRLYCGYYGSIWPRPTKLIDLRSDLGIINPDDIRFEIIEPVEEQAPDDFKGLVNGMCEVLVEDLKKICKNGCNGTVDYRLLVKISIGSTTTDLTWDTDESYSLSVETKDKIITASIEGQTAFGAKHGLQTLSQLMTIVSRRSLTFMVMMKQAYITDAPAYPHRGLLIDTSRHFLSMDTIKRTIDGMAQCKLNVLHWHATDSQSFPLMFANLPELANFGAYSDEELYWEEDIRELISYGLKRGVRIIMEIDGPSHAGNGWQYGPYKGYGDLAVCVNQMPWRSYCIQPPCGSLNPTNTYTYQIWTMLYKKLIEVFPKGAIYHLGGDELKISCWNSSDSILDFMKGEGMGRETEDFIRLWAHFHNRTKHILDKHTKNDNPSILWSSQLTNPKYIEKYLDKKKFVIQTWTNSAENDTTELLAKGYKVIVSTKDAWYLDHGFWKNTPYYEWSKVYDNRIPSSSAGVYGGEVCMWGEYVDDSAIDSRIWPRAAAAAERLWSNPPYRKYNVVYRLMQLRRRLIQLGLRPEAIIPQWCDLNEGTCE